jgi:dihydrofolate reductase
MGTAPKGSWTTYVFSRSLTAGEAEGVTFVSQSPRDFIGQLRGQPGKHICLIDGGELTRAFLANDLIDEIVLGIVPQLRGDGIPAFPAGFPQRDFKLLANQADAAGGIRLRFEHIR